MKIVVAITGASGVVLGKRLIEELRGHEVHAIVSSSAKEVARHEKVDLEPMQKLATVHEEANMCSPLASSSNLVDAMVVVPCSMKTLSAIANGYDDNLITRAAENILKMGGKLVVVPRDTPITLAAIDNMRNLKLAGAIILPPNVAYYGEPKTVDDVTDFLVGKIFDSLRIDHRLYKRWRGH
ncbi:MAG: UbiX family flavin prenyltransferase [Candidatus Altiarchaeota archaeon]